MLNETSEEIYIYSRSRSRHPGFNWKSLKGKSSDENIDELYSNIAKFIDSQEKSFILATKDKDFIFFISGINVKEKDITDRNIRANLLVISNSETLIKQLLDKYLIETNEFENLIISSLKYNENADYQIIENSPLLNFFSDIKNNNDSNMKRTLISDIKNEKRYFSEYNEENKKKISAIIKDIKIERKIDLAPFLIVTKNIGLNKLKSYGASFVITDYLDQNFEDKKKTPNLKLLMMLILVVLVILLVLLLNSQII